MDASFMPGKISEIDTVSMTAGMRALFPADGKNLLSRNLLAFYNDSQYNG
jgi:hypothetical protein